VALSMLFIFHFASARHDFSLLITSFPLELEDAVVFFRLVSSLY